MEVNVLSTSLSIGARCIALPQNVGSARALLWCALCSRLRRLLVHLGSPQIQQDSITIGAEV
jgi:hypothetical protein